MKVEPEIREINAIITKNSLHEDGSNKCLASIKLFAGRSFIIPFILISFVFFIGHFSGKTPLQTYSVQIFHTLKAPIDKYYATIFLGVCELLGTIVCVILVHFTGKRPLMLVSTIGCGLCFLGTATYAYYIDLVPGTSVNNIVANLSSVNLKNTVLDIEYDLNKTILIYSNNSTDSVDFFKNSEQTVDYEFNNVDYMEESMLELNETNDDFKNTTTTPEAVDDKLQNAIPEDILIQLPKLDENKYLWLPLTLLLGSAFLTHIGIRLLPWMLIGEIFPANVRNVASGLAGGLGYIFGFLANKLFLTMIESMTLPGTFWFYSAVGLIGALILYFVLPETEGRSLMEIESHYTGGRKLGKFHESMAESPLPRNIEISRHPDVILRTNGATQKSPPALMIKVSENLARPKSRIPLATATPPSTPASQPNQPQGMSLGAIVETQANTIAESIKPGQIVTGHNVLKIKIGESKESKIPVPADVKKIDLKNWENSDLFEKHLQHHKSKSAATKTAHPNRTHRLNSLLLNQDNLHHTSMLLGMKKSRLVHRNNKQPINRYPQLQSRTSLSSVPDDHEKDVYDTKL